MPSTIVFETAALADAIKKADKVAPTKGTAFDKAAGIIMQFDPQGPLPLAVIRATNLEVSSMEWVNVAEWGGDVATWRLPSVLLTSVISSLPIGSDKTVKLYSENSGMREVIHLQSGRTKVRFHPIDMQYYTLWGAFNPDDMYPATDLGGRLSQVEWATSKSDIAMSGVYLDGEHAIATDKFRLARVPLSIPDLPNPIVIPSGILGSILRATGEVQIGSDGHMLHVMPDETTQIKAVIMDVQYPNIQSVMDRVFDTEIEISRDGLIAVLARVNVFGEGDRQAAFRLFFGEEEIRVYMRHEAAGDIGDVLEVPGYAKHGRFEMRFTPKNLLDPLTKSPNDKVKICYNLAEGLAKGVIKIDDGAGYESWVMSRSTKEA